MGSRMARIDVAVKIRGSTAVESGGVLLLEVLALKEAKSSTFEMEAVTDLAGDGPCIDAVEEEGSLGVYSI